MKPVAFEYCRPDSIEEALELLVEFGGDASVMAGGMSLGAMLNMRLVRPRAVIDINRIAALAETRREGAVFETGATLRQADALASAAVAAAVPLLRLALPHVGHYQTRSRGTLGGSAAHADPSAEIPLCLVALGGEIELRSRRRSRRVAAREFFHGVLTTSRAPDELVTKLAWPAHKPGRRYAFEEIAQRLGDYAIAAAACAVELDSAGKIAFLALGFGGIEDRPFAVDAKAFIGAKAAAATFQALVADAASKTTPLEDLQASAAYRRQLMRVLGQRVLQRAFDESARKH
ncbi:MAG: carbon monoxide dehydrogenase [Rhodospirillales bacterium]|nr:carbon monoxide dehydrogenase [Rhodospirillales bacterium]